MDEDLKKATWSWLESNAERRYWLVIVQRLLEDDPRAELPHIDEWLGRRLDHPAWPWLWALRQPNYDDGGVAVAARWLQARPASLRWLDVVRAAWSARPQDADLARATAGWLLRNLRAEAWFDVFDSAWSVVPRDIDLRLAATAWLRAQPRAEAWLAVFALLQKDGLDDDQRAAAEPWLRRSVEHPAWWWVFVDCIGRAEASHHLVRVGRAWLRQHPGSCGVGPVQAILDREATSHGG
jgi:hypothetical protein